MGTIKRQVRIVFDLNKCLGCQACSVACKTMWTDRHKGHEYMYWNNVESQPGRGYPMNWETIGEKSGFDKCVGEVNLTGPLPPLPTYDPAWEYNHAAVLKTEGGDATETVVKPTPEPEGAGAYSVNWDEDVGTGTMPNAYYFYLPRICNHCTKPACLASCPQQAIYKRAEDGIVLLDQERCQGFRMCNRACPYKKSYFNPLVKKSEKCVFCFPRMEQGVASFCFTQCAGRIRYVGFSDDKEANVNKLIDKWKVALRLHPEFGTEPNLYYIPPLSPPGFDEQGRPANKPRIPVEVLARYFGDRCDQPPAEREARIREVLDKIERERDKARNGKPSELIDILTAYREKDRLQIRKL